MSNNNPKLYTFLVIYFNDISNLLKIKSIVISVSEDSLCVIKESSSVIIAKINVLYFRAQWLRLVKARIFAIVRPNNP